MPFRELLAEAVLEHEVLQAKYDEALAEINSLRTRFAAAPSWDFSINSLGSDIEVALPQQRFMLEPLHRAPFEEQEAHKAADTDEIATRSEGLSQKQSLKPGKTASLKTGKTGSMKSSAPRKTEMRPMPSDPFYDEEPLPEGDTPSERAIRFLRSKPVEFTLLAIVLSNVVTLVLETDMRASKEALPATFELLNWVFMVVYVCEFALRVFAYRFSVFADTWNRMDCLVIALDIATTLIEALLGIDVGFNPSMFRVLRIARLVKASGTLRHVTELQLLVHGFVGAVKAVFWATLMLEIMVLMWSLVYVEVLYPRVLVLTESGTFEDCSRCQEAYSSVWFAHNTIWQQIIAGDSWGMITLNVVEKWPSTLIVYMSSLMTIEFAMLNLIFTVIVDAAIKTRESDQAHKLKEKEMSFENIKNKLIGLCEMMDEDESGELTLDELLVGYENNKEFADTMLALDITLDDMQTLFMIMDEDRSGAVSYMEFVNNIYKMKEQDLHTMLMFVKGYVIDLRFKIKDDVTEKLKENLKHSLESTQHIEAMSVHIENVVSHVDTLMSQRSSNQRSTASQGNSSGRGVTGSSSGRGATEMQRIDSLMQQVETLMQRLHSMTQQVESIASSNKQCSTVSQGTSSRAGVTEIQRVDEVMQHVESLMQRVEGVMQHVEHVALSNKHCSTVSNGISSGAGTTEMQRVDSLMGYVESLMQRVDSVMQHVESGSLSKSNYSTVSQGQQQAGLPNNSTKELAFILETQADILRAVRRPKAPKASPGHSIVLPPTFPPYLVMPKTPKSSRSC